MPTRSTTVVVANLKTLERYADKFEVECWTGPSGSLFAGPLFSKAVPNSSVISGTVSGFVQGDLIMFQGLTIGTTYYFRTRVHPVAGGVASPWTATPSSAPGWVSEVAGDLTAPNPTYSTNSTSAYGGVIISGNPAGVPADLDHYEFYHSINVSGTPAASALPTVPRATTAVFSMHVNDTDTLYVWVRAVDTSGNQQAWNFLGGFNSRGVNVIISPTTIPGQPTSLAVHGVGAGYAMLSWAEPTGIPSGYPMYYQVQAALDAGFTSGVSSYGGSAGMAANQFSIRVPNVTIYWQVRAKFQQSNFGAYAVYGVSLNAGLVNLDADVADGIIYLRSIQQSTALAVDNANFEASSSLPVPGWFADGAGTVLSYETVSPHFGTRSLKVVTDHTFGAALSYRFYKVTPGEVYKVSSYAKMLPGTNNADCQLMFLDGGQGYVGGIQPNTSATGWTFISATGTVPASAVMARLSLQTGASGTAWFDDISVVRLTSLDDEVLDGTTYRRILYVDPDNTFHLSTVLNPQGSTIPTPSTASPFNVETVNNSGSSRGATMGIRWAAQTVYRPDGTNIAIGDSSGVAPVPPAPTGATAVASGTESAAGLVPVGVAYCASGRVFGRSDSFDVNIIANRVLNVPSPPNPGGMDGWVPYWAGTAFISGGGGGGCFVHPSAPLAFGPNWQSPTGLTISQLCRSFTGPLSQFSGLCGAAIVMTVNLGTSTTYAYYPYYASGAISFADGLPATPSLASAAKMFYDGNTPLATSVGIVFTTPAAGGSSGGGGGGGCVRKGTKIVPLGTDCVGVEEPNSIWVRVRTESGLELEATPDHPVYVSESGKIPLCDVKVGDSMVTEAGESRVVEVVEFEEEGIKVRVVMNDGHLYWANGILSHNIKP